MKLALLLAVAAIFTGCATGPSVLTVVDGPKGQTTKPLVRLPANIKGDLVVTREGFSVTTPRNADGTLAVERRPVLNKDRSAVLGYAETPAMAEVDSSGPIEAWGRSFATGIRAAGSFAGTFLAGMAGIGAAGQTGQAAVSAVGH